MMRIIYCAVISSLKENFYRALENDMMVMMKNDDDY